MTHISHVHRPRYRFHISYCFRVIEDGIIPKNFWSGTYLLTEGAHRQGSVAASINGMQRPLSGLRGQVIDPLDVNDARLSHLWQHLRRPRYGHESEQDWHARSLAVYDLSSEASRCDATTGSGEHDVTDGGLGPFGHSKEAPSRPQRTVMTGS